MAHNLATDADARKLARAARALIDEFGGDVPDWLRETGAVDRLVLALDPFERAPADKPLIETQEFEIGDKLTRDMIDELPGVFVNPFVASFAVLLENVDEAELERLEVPWDDLSAVASIAKDGETTQVWATVDHPHREDSTFVRVL